MKTGHISDKENAALEIELQKNERKMPLYASKMSSQPRRRMKYDAAFKIKVVQAAKDSSNSAAARHYCVSEKLVRDWRKAENTIKELPLTKCANRGQNQEKWPRLEKEIATWVLSERQCGRIVTRALIRLKALQWAAKNKEDSMDFKATVSWCSRFMHRHDLVIRLWEEDDDIPSSSVEHDIIPEEDPYDDHLNAIIEITSPEAGPSSTVFGCKIEEEKCEVSDVIENTVVKVKTEPSGDSTNDNIISMFSESDDETVDCSQHDVMNLKSEPKEEFQQNNSELEGLSVKRGATSPEEGPSCTVFDCKIKEQKKEQNNDDIISMFSESNDETVDCSQRDVMSLKSEPKEELQQINCQLEGLSVKRGATSPEEGPSFTVFDCKIKEQKCDVTSDTENMYVTVKTEQSDDSTNDDIISMFSESDNETVDCSQHDVMSLKCEPKEELQQINCQLKGLSDLNPYLNNYSGKQFPGHHVVKTKSLVSKSTNYRSLNQSGDNIFDETLLRVNNQKISNISHVESMSYSNNVCDKELGKNHSPELNVKSLKKLYRCEECGKQVVSKSNLKIHLRVHVQDKSHSCNVCGKTFRSNSQLNRHEKIHTGEKPHRCLVCGKNFSSSSYIREHMRIHTGEKPYSCVVCNKGFRSNCLLKQHSAVHMEEKPHSCLVCGKKFFQNSSLKIHLRKHTGEKPYSCLVCGKKFFQNCNLKIHLRTHTGEKPYSCSECGKTCLTNSNLKVHLRTHAEEKPYNCSVCGKTCFTNNCLKMHMRTHTGEKLYRCLLCEKQFLTNSGLNKHKEIHSGEKPYSCVVCRKGFLNMGDLKLHKRVHTVVKPYICVVCNKGYRSNCSLKQHNKVHMEEKPHSCLVCGKKFFRKSCLQIHLRTHTGEKPYSCLVCGKTCISNSSLNVHMRTHTGEKPYSCLVCGKTYSTNTNVKIHLRKHTGEKSYNCSECGETCSTKNSLKMHLRTHTGEKLYSCLLCEKQFLTSSGLNKHKKMHTGEKPYSCVVCHQGFLNKSNLKQHKKLHIFNK